MATTIRSGKKCIRSNGCLVILLSASTHQRQTFCKQLLSHNKIAACECGRMHLVFIIIIIVIIIRL